MREERILFGDHIAKGSSREVKHNSFGTETFWTGFCSSLDGQRLLHGPASDILLPVKEGHVKILSTSGPRSDIEFLYCHVTGSSLNLALARRGGNHLASQWLSACGQLPPMPPDPPTPRSPILSSLPPPSVPSTLFRAWTTKCDFLLPVGTYFLKDAFRIKIQPSLKWTPLQ